MTLPITSLPITSLPGLTIHVTPVAPVTAPTAGQPDPHASNLATQTPHHHPHLAPPVPGQAAAIAAGLSASDARPGDPQIHDIERTLKPYGVAMLPRATDT